MAVLVASAPASRMTLRPGDAVLVVRSAPLASVCKEQVLMPDWVVGCCKRRLKQLGSTGPWYDSWPPRPLGLSQSFRNPYLIVLRGVRGFDPLLYE